LEYFLIERRNIVGFAAGNEVAIDNHLLVHPLCPSVLEVRLE
jgi:hypothetical protein